MVFSEMTVWCLRGKKWNRGMLGVSVFVGWGEGWAYEPRVRPVPAGA